jgi:hypothetical protein
VRLISVLLAAVAALSPSSPQKLIHMPAALTTKRGAAAAAAETSNLQRRHHPGQQ